MYPNRPLLATIVATVICSTLAIGISYWVAGHFKLGKFIRYIPYPVVTGFLAGAGFLLLQFSVTLTTGFQLNYQNLDRILLPENLLKLGMGAAVALSLIYTSRPGIWRFAMPLFLLATIVAFLFAIQLTGLTPEYWLQHDWMLARALQTTSYPPIGISDLTFVEWHVVLKQAPQIAILIMVVLIATLIKISTLEMVVGEEVDQNQELQAHGIGNMICGMAGGVAGFQTLSLTVLAKRLHAEYRLVGLFVCIFCIAAMFYSGDMLIHMPRFVFGGLMFWVGSGLLYESLVLPFKTLNKLDFSIIVLIVLSMVIVGIMPGIVIGLVAGTLLFVLDYSRINIIRQEYSGSNFRSNVDRSSNDRALLEKHGNEILILRLHGYLFFGTAYRFIEQLKARLADRPANQIKYIVLDLEKVSGADSSAYMTLTRLRFLATTHNFSYFISGATTHVKHALDINTADFGNHNHVSTQFYATLDEALEWYEEQQLQKYAVGTRLEPSMVLESFVGKSASPNTIVNLMGYLELVNFAENAVLFPQNTLTNSIYLVKSGTLDIELPVANSQPVRLRKIGPAAVIGEVSMYLNMPTTATVTTRQKCQLWRLSRENLKLMLCKDPELAAIFHERMATILASRLADNSRLIQVLAKS